MTSASLRTSLLKLGNATLYTPLNCANSPTVTNALAFSTEMIVAKASASLSLLLHVRPVTSTPSLLPSIQVRDSFKALIMLSRSPSGAPEPKKITCSFAVSPNCKVRSLFGFLQSYGCPHAPHHQPLTLCCLRLCLHGWWTLHPKRSSTRDNPQCSQTCGSDGSSSFCFSYHMPEEVRALPLLTPHAHLGTKGARNHSRICTSREKRG